MRFQAPPRAAVDACCWTRPPLASWSARFPWLAAPDWPAIADLNDLLAGRRHRVSGHPLCLVAETPALFKDGLHYEQRIFREGRISTRERNWHDLFNALIWLEHTAIKSALNARYVAEMMPAAVRERNRAQMALTHFDEAGAVVFIERNTAVSCWDAHDWPGLFRGQAEDWRSGRIRVSVFGHALLEHALLPRPESVAKCLVLETESTGPASDQAVCEAALAQAIRSGKLLNDPQDLRPLPLAGIPGWHPGAGSAQFFDAACFRPLRAGRRYPPPWPVEAAWMR